MSLMALDYEEISVGNTVVGLSQSKVSPANAPAMTLAFITVEDAPVRYRYDGGDPSATAGHLANVGSSITLFGTNNLRQFKAIRSSTTNARLIVTYER